MALAQQNEKNSTQSSFIQEKKKKLVNEIKKVIRVNCPKSETDKFVAEPDEVKQRWKDHVKRLLNMENDWNGFDGEDIYECSEKVITEVEVMAANGQLKCNNARRPTGLVDDTFKAAGNAGEKAMSELCNKILFEGNKHSD